MMTPKPELPKQVESWTRPEAPQIVTADNIFDYMNGAGELYIGYRFDHLEVFEYQSEEQQNILVELYYMKTPDDAFGLLSLDWGGEPIDLPTSGSGNSTSIPDSWPTALYGEGLLRLRSDNIYSRIMAYQETPEAKRAVLALGRSTASERGNRPVPSLINELPAFFPPDWQRIDKKTSYFRSHLVLNSLYYLSHENLLELDHSTEAVTASYQKKSERFRLLQVRYPDSDLAIKALDHFLKSYIPEHPLDPGSDPDAETTGVLQVEDGWMGYRTDGGIITFLFECSDQITARSILELIKNTTN